MLKKFKLKHLDLITQEQVNYAYFMKELDGFTYPLWGKKKAFEKSFFKVRSFISDMRKIDPQKTALNPDSKIRYPHAVDSISFAAMMNVQTLSSKDGSTGELLADFISIICFSENYKCDFDTDSFQYKDFKKRVLNEPALDMLGLYNHLDKQLREAEKVWEKRFLEVRVEDNDYFDAGGAKLNSFNVINSIKSICSEFNLPYKKAWQLSYSIVQTNSLAKATAAQVQEKMTKIKEARMKSKRAAR